MKKRDSYRPSLNGDLLADPVSLEVLHEGIMDLLLGIGAYRSRSDPLAEAYLACLEAAESIFSLLTQLGKDGADHGQDALHAARAAVMAIKIAIVKEGDNQRLSANQMNNEIDCREK